MSQRNNDSATPAADTHFHASRAASSRKKGFIGLAAAVVIAAGGYGVWYAVVGSRYVTTDNAYSAAEVAEVTPSVTGIVQAVNVVDTQWVKQGEVLVQLDDTDARLALAQAEAMLGQSRRRVSSYMATDEGLAAQVKAREADETQAQARLVASQADFTKAQVDLTRREALAKSGAVSGEELTNARNAMAQAESNLNVAKAAAVQSVANRLSTIGAKKANAALTIDATVETNPEVMLAKAKVEQAQVDLARTIIKAPVDGVIARRQVQIGKRVQNGERLMTVVPLHDVHIDANFKEVELRHVKIGQPVEVTADIYGDKVVYHGVVSGVSGGTGSAFSMIPAQNATGNWIKVVQRLPLRITLDKQELAKHPLQVGLSMIATIDTHKTLDLAASGHEGLTTARQD
ncbi:MULTISPECIES: HlyD family efflux transporter periplasmic adaptor subunit [unclassified Symbiopectobacterium]|uniref:HlyD family secretion protein n=1 Tax=unclassified Symbiopectobacterium TaxID=2794573 RepID=UPI0029CABEC3|nr:MULTISPECIES: HlyD family efflux transporter periplasmic adaptor subunit [unclassified Symbiopectobacterium]MCW2476711.1 HlyD family efflux transporter periplasmic adaptor subunit [Candidatus Symbiopectobacterium sp. NZEC151]MCW2488044.1 HlyD family efflux transporter periplasmic adaptor subunit [Candidatus Symbiopectobacterium sp. NZEC127]